LAGLSRADLPIAADALTLALGVAYVPVDHAGPVLPGRITLLTAGGMIRIDRAHAIATAGRARRAVKVAQGPSGTGALRTRRVADLVARPHATAADGLTGTAIRRTRKPGRTAARQRRRVADLARGAQGSVPARRTGLAGAHRQRVGNAQPVPPRRAAVRVQATHELDARIGAEARPHPVPRRAAVVDAGGRRRTV